jgi:hypothetical protein
MCIALTELCTGFARSIYLRLLFCQCQHQFSTFKPQTTTLAFPNLIASQKVSLPESRGIRRLGSTWDAFISYCCFFFLTNPIDNYWRASPGSCYGPRCYFLSPLHELAPPFAERSLPILQDVGGRGLWSDSGRADPITHILEDSGRI